MPDIRFWLMEVQKATSKVGMKDIRKRDPIFTFFFLLTGEAFTQMILKSKYQRFFFVRFQGGGREWDND